MKITIRSLVVLIALFLATGFTYAQQDWQPVKAVDSSKNLEIMKAYAGYVKIPGINITVPTVVEADFDASVVFSGNFAVFNDTTQSFVPIYTVSKSATGPVITYIGDYSKGGNIYELFDNNSLTKKDFYLNGSGVNTLGLSVRFSESIKTNSLTISLDRNVSLPDTVTLQALVNNKWVMVLNKVRPTGATLTFPETKALEWVIQMDYSQSIRIADISFSNLTSSVAKNSVRFLAQPKSTYTIYVNSDRSVDNYANYEGSYNLTTNQYKNIGMFTVSSNPLFSPSDLDNDGVIDTIDNCKSHSNSDQKDEDKNGVGDVCDDYDKDGVINSIDNCPNLPNYDQRDTDGDKIGDKCDEDESRLTEKYPVVVWFGLGFASIVFMALLFIAGMKMRKNLSTNTAPNDNNINQQ